MINANNVFLSEFKTSHGAIPFDKIKITDYEPAIKAGIQEQNAEIASIVNQRSTPTFTNTIVALERSGKTLKRVLNVFYPLTEAEADDNLMDISTRVTPLISRHGTSITLNPKLWERVKFVYDNKSKLSLDKEDEMLLADTYLSFVRNGANLTGPDREKYSQLTDELSTLSLQFSQNALKELNRIELWLTENDLKGLPENAIAVAKSAAEAKGRKNEYLITLDAPSYRPFMKYATRRDLREKLYKLYNARNTNGEYSNVEIIKQIADKRMQIANLLGYKTFADYQLEQTMAQNTANVYKLLDQLRVAYLPAERAEIKKLTEFASKLEGCKMEIKPWDYSYYASKLKDSEFELNDEMLRPYFELNNVIKGVFGLAEKLYGVTLVENFDAQVFNPEVQAFDVKDADGSFLGMIYTDFFPRPTKRSGAWMTEFQSQHISENGTDVRPIVSVTMNFTRPSDDKPSLLTYDEVETFLHEFGHALHGLLTKTKYASMSGTSVYRDFVELPSQFNENYLSQKEFLDSFAKHYLTNEPMPQSLVDKITQSTQYAAAYSCFRQLNFGYIDMAWHTITKPVSDVSSFEKNAQKKVEIFAPVEGCLISPQFSHIFSGGYAAGYYSYKWAEVLDADAFAKFKESGIFNRETAKSFRDNILSKGGTENPMELYKRFRGDEPKIDALLERDGIRKPTKQKVKEIKSLQD